MSDLPIPVSTLSHYSDKEVSNQYGFPQNGYAPIPVGGATAAISQAPEGPKILGLKRTTFILSVLLIILIGAAIGGSVGGTMAAESRCNANLAKASSPTATVTVTEDLVTSTAGVGANPTNGSPTTATTIVVPTAGTLALDCPKINSTTQSVKLDETSTFKFICNMDMNGDNVDILAVISYLIGDCLEACASYNRNSGSKTCKGVVFNPNLTEQKRANFGTCFLKKFTNVQNPSTQKSVAAILQ